MILNMCKQYELILMLVKFIYCAYILGFIFVKQITKDLFPHHKYLCFLHCALYELKGNESFQHSVKGCGKEFRIATGCACFLFAWTRYLLWEAFVFFHHHYRFAAHVFGSHKNHSRCSSSVVIHLISHIPYSS